jgi:hypothetical protein
MLSGKLRKGGVTLKAAPYVFAIAAFVLLEAGVGIVSFDRGGGGTNDAIIFVVAFFCVVMSPLCALGAAMVVWVTRRWYMTLPPD